MSFDADRLWNLLPAHIRVEDTKLANPTGPDALGQWAPGPLRQWVEVIASQVSVLEENLEQLYDNHFVETAAPWALPYIGDLLGIRGLPAGKVGRSARAEVGHTLAYRRRKGTAAVLEQLARDITGWPTRAVEFFVRLAATQHLNHVRHGCVSFASLRGADTLAWVGTAFETTTRTVEVRRMPPGLGKWNIPNVGLFVWRLVAYSRTQSPLVATSLSARHLRFHALGLDAPLVQRPETEDEITHLATPENVPLPITRRRLKADAVRFQANPELYGSGRSLLIEEFDSAAADYLIVPAQRVVVCDLEDVMSGGALTAWSHENAGQPTAEDPAGRIAVDPQRGRIVFPAAPDAQRPPRATFYHLFSHGVGGGEYDRASSFASRALPVVAVPSVHESIGDALTQLGTTAGVIEIEDSGRYSETFNTLSVVGFEREIRAADQRWPSVILTQPVVISGDADGIVTLNGLLMSGEPLTVDGALGRLRLRHCTLMPHFQLNEDGTHTPNADPALTVPATNCTVEIAHCILKPIRVGPDVRVELRNCIVDAGSETAYALSGLAGNDAAGTWRLENCTVIGRVAAAAIELASNTIFLGASVQVERRQEGCLRFCWVPPNSPVPRRYRCLPEPEVPERNVRPGFTSLLFGQAGYGQLGARCPDAIRRGADDGAEMGAFHDLFQPQREAHLKARLEEYLRFGLETGLFHAT